MNVKFGVGDPLDDVDPPHPEHPKPTKRQVNPILNRPIFTQLYLHIQLGTDLIHRSQTIYIVVGYRKEIWMRVAKWGNSLAVRLPAAVVEALDLKAGESREVHVTGTRTLEVGRYKRKDEAVARLRELRRPLPADFIFDRDEANAR